ncbi:hypothetical protein BGLT_03678 [Caballeronia glathei]|jgi:hypothetical protein|uniref:Uncharacterized protein n=1 Tax=Caballeronia glathei TaxID=60547 RepID=A0A069PB78_9BURK|nr:hypothetical protein [Caballeronia glathei]KDR37915.1 hypothetical protein BG61_05760 [Caballeronia glathei]TCK39706.1 hypothetical protein B0G84_5046 [Paraburkholderia sp. BL8N3]CDY74736.1 hypothetical protein BGLT_03678 [Caballeronia glathei]
MPARCFVPGFALSSPKAAARSAPQFGQLSAFLRSVLPQRWQTTEKIDAGKVRRVVMLKPSKDMCDVQAAQAGNRAERRDATREQQSFVLPDARTAPREATNQICVNSIGTSIAFRT